MKIPGLALLVVLSLFVLLADKAAVAVPVLILLALLVVLSGKETVPMLIFGLMPNTMRYSFDDSFASQGLILKSSALQDWLRRLRELGFYLLGVKVEKLPLWGRAYREVALASQEAETFASIVLHSDGNPASLYFYTPFESKGMIFTRNYASAPEAESETLSVKNVPTQDFQEILESHGHRLHVFKGRGFVPCVDYSQQSRIEATRAFYASKYARQLVLSPRVLHFGVLLLLFLGAACRFAMSAG